MENETMIQKKKSTLPIIIVIAAILIVAAVICYFSFFSEAAVRDREIKAHIASAEKYLDNLDYENAIAEYEAALKLNPKAEDVLDSYVDTVIAYAEEVAETDPVEAADILEDAAEFLDEISDGNKEVEKLADELKKIANEYWAEVNTKNDSDDDALEDTADDDTASVDIDESRDDDLADTDTTPDTQSDDDAGNDGERSDILPYEQNGYIIFGAYEQDGDLTNGPEPIEWEVLGTDENGTLLISRYILDFQPYNNEYTDVTWEICSLRAWLNDDFLNDAFTLAEQAVINPTNVVNADSSYYGTSGGNNTVDKVFCLSTDEILKYYTFDTYHESHYGGCSYQLMASATQYAKDKGVEYYKITEDEYTNHYIYYGYARDCIDHEGSEWWLRSPGYNSSIACYVFYLGYAAADLSEGVANEEGIRPALYITW